MKNIRNVQEKMISLDHISNRVMQNCKIELIDVLDTYTEEYIKWIFMRYTIFIAGDNLIDCFLNLHKMDDVSNVHRESIIYCLDMDNNDGCISEQSFLVFLRDCQKIDPQEYIKYKPQPPPNFGMPQPPCMFDTSDSSYDLPTLKRKRIY